MANNQQLIKLLETVIRKEVKRQVDAIVPILVKESMTQMISGLITEQAIPAAPQGNSHKRRALQESLQSLIEDDIDTEEAVASRSPRLTKAQLAEKMGYGDVQPALNTTKSGMIVPMAITDSGTPYDPREIGDSYPEFLLEKFNKDYRPLMAQLNNKGTMNG